MLRSLRAALAAAAATAAVIAFAPGASATIYERFTFEESYSETFDECGLTIHVEGHFEAQGHIRTIKQSGGQAYLSHANNSFSERFNNADDPSRFVTASGHSLFKETKGTHLYGDVWQFDLIEAGSPVTVRDSSGKVIASDHGVIHYRAVFDTQGDGAPGGEEISFEMVSMSGPHPLFFADFCEVVSPYLS